MKVIAAIILIACLPTLYTLVTGDYPGVVWFYGQEEDSSFLDAVLSLREMF